MILSAAVVSRHADLCIDSRRRRRRRRPLLRRSRTHHPPQKRTLPLQYRNTSTHRRTRFGATWLSCVVLARHRPRTGQVRRCRLPFATDFRADARRRLDARGGVGRANWCHRRECPQTAMHHWPAGDRLRCQWGNIIRHLLYMS